MIRFFYTLLLSLASPFLLYSLYKKREGKPEFGSRWKEHFGYTPTISSNKQPLWIHAVSVGEVIAATPIIKALKIKYPETTILVTTTTSTGAAQVDKLGSLVVHRYMPIDFSFTVRRFVKTVKPSKMLIMETELWPNTLNTVASFGVPIIVLNARLSEKSFRNYQKVQPVFNLLSKNLSHICCQYQDDATRFIELGLDPEKVSVTGSVKFDISISNNIRREAKELRSAIGSDRPVWVAASTHTGEDEQILIAHKALLKTHPNALLILVPRHPERFNDVYSLCQNKKFKVVRRTSDPIVTSDVQIYLGDTMGELLTLMGASDICFMGGSLVGEKVGGHNVLEPVALGVPTITGPSYFNFVDIVTGLTSCNAIRISEDSEMLVQLVQDLFSNRSAREELSSNALNFLTSNQGAIKNTLNRLGYE